MMFTKNDYRFFEKAKCVAAISDFNKVHIGCVAVYRGQVIGIGCNTNKTHTNQMRYNRFRNEVWIDHKAHAEIACLNQIKHMNLRWDKVKLYIFRIRHDKPYGMSRPCPACMAAIKDMGIKNVYYTTDAGYVYEQIA